VPSRGISQKISIFVIFSRKGAKAQRVSVNLKAIRPLLASLLPQISEEKEQE
jgi:hypothetical protein